MTESIAAKWAAFTEGLPNEHREPMSIVFEREARWLQTELTGYRGSLGSLTVFIFPCLRRIFSPQEDGVEWSLGDGDRENLVKIPIDYEPIHAIDNGVHYYGIDRETEIVSEYARQIRSFLNERGPVVVGKRPLVIGFDSCNLNIHMDLLD